MITFFTPLTICVATFIGFICGFLWYSPMLFVKAWMRGEGITKETAPKRSPKELLVINLYSLVAHGAITLTLAVIYEVLAVSSLKVALALGLLLTFGFIVTTRFIDMIYTVHSKHYEARAQIKFLVSSGYYLFTVTIITSALMYMRTM
jgi:predicted transporter